MMLMMLVSVSTFCQFPTTKVLNGDSVVIMTLNQGRKINTKFTELNDEISKLNFEIKKNNVELRYMENVITKITKDFQFTRDSMNVLKKERDYYKNEYSRIKNLEFSDRKARKTMRVGLIVLAATWITFIVTAVK